MINPAHSVEELARIFAANKSIVINDFLEPSYAEDLYNFFNKEMPNEWWFASYKDMGDSKDYKQTKFLQHFPENQEFIEFEKQKANHALLEGYFSYIFDRTTPHKPKCPCKECNFKRHLGGTTFLDFVSTLTCEHLTQTNELFASRYTSEQFLGPHHDKNKGKIGFVLNLTKDWKPEYGGLLHFMEKDYKTVTKVILPEFNKLTLFSVPVQAGIPHFVSRVVPNLKLNRISYTGWFS